MRKPANSKRFPLTPFRKRRSPTKSSSPNAAPTFCSQSLVLALKSENYFLAIFTRVDLTVAPNYANITPRGWTWCRSSFSRVSRGRRAPVVLYNGLFFSSSAILIRVWCRRLLIGGTRGWPSCVQKGGAVVVVMTTTTWTPRHAVDRRAGSFSGKEIIWRAFQKLLIPASVPIDDQFSSTFGVYIDIPSCALLTN